jgi:hypothetical protein
MASSRTPHPRQRLSTLLKTSPEAQYPFLCGSNPERWNAGKTCLCSTQWRWSDVKQCGIIPDETYVGQTLLCSQSQILTTADSKSTADEDHVRKPPDMSETQFENAFNKANADSFFRDVVGYSCSLLSCKTKHRAMSWLKASHICSTHARRVYHRFIFMYSTCTYISMEYTKLYTDEHIDITRARPTSATENETCHRFNTLLLHRSTPAVTCQWLLLLVPKVHAVSQIF